MRINVYLAQATGQSRRSADKAIAAGSVKVNNKQAVLGQEVSTKDTVTLNNKVISLPEQKTTIILNKPVGFVCSRAGQGNKTIYELLPHKLHDLKPVGRLD